MTRALTLDANFPFALYVQGHLYAQAGRLDDAIAAFERAVVTSGRTAKYLYVLAETYVQAGRKDQAALLLRELVNQSQTGFVPPEFIRNLSAELKPGTEAARQSR